MKKITRVFSFLFAVIMIVTSINPMQVQAAKIVTTDSNGNTKVISNFTDTKKHKDAKLLLKWADYGVAQLIASPNGKFYPDKALTRGEISAVLDKIMGLSDMSYNYFNDLSNSHKYRDAILKSVAAKYIYPSANDNISPNSRMSRDYFAVVMCRVFRIPTSSKDKKTSFKDNSKIKKDRVKYVRALEKYGYIKKDKKGNFNPRGYITRAEMFEILDRICSGYIPAKDDAGLGSTFTNNFPKNIVVARDITYSKGTVGKDMILTQSVRSANLASNTVKGRLIILGRTNLTLDKCKVNTIAVRDKSTILGVDKNIGSVYIYESGTESTLDAIPKKLVLSPGVRVKIDGVMYENKTKSTKTYLGRDIKADIAEEQGFVTGGPQVQSSEFSQTIDNEVSLYNTTIRKGNEDIKEVGVIYSNSAKIPTLQSNDGAVKYKGKAYSDFRLPLGKIDTKVDTRTYRVYVKDVEGVIGYGKPVTMNRFDFTLDMKLVDTNYPSNFNVEVILTGKAIPEVQTMLVVCSDNANYAEKHQEVNLSLKDSVTTDSTGMTVKRYVGSVNSGMSYDEASESNIYVPPTMFGYNITFANNRGNMQKFPVLTNAKPEGVSPVNIIMTGVGKFEHTGVITVKNSRIDTSFVEVEEAGILYKNVDAMQSPGNASATDVTWSKETLPIHMGVGEVKYYDVSIPILSTSGNTYFTAYIKTPNGYYYGDLKCVSNSWTGDESGPIATGEAKVLMLQKDKALVQIPLGSNTDVDMYKAGSIISFTDSKGTIVEQYTNKMLAMAEGSVSNGNLNLVFSGLKANSRYKVMIQAYDRSGKASSVIYFTVDTSNLAPITLTNRSITNDVVTYTINASTLGDKVSVIDADCTLDGVDARIITSSMPWKLNLLNMAKGDKGEVTVRFIYYIARGIGNIRTVEFERTFSVTK